MPPAPRVGDEEPTPVEVTATPESGKPVVLATGRDEEFVIPGKKDDGSDATRVTSAGVAVSKTEAKRITEAATASGVTLIEKDGN